MASSRPLRVVLLKPSKYGLDGCVERFRRGFMPNTTLPHLASLTPAEVNGRRVQIHAVDEYVETDLEYLRLLHADPSSSTLLALVGVQSHQFHRALDLAAYARRNGVTHSIIGGPHAMTCDTTAQQGRGMSVALAEAELVWPEILHDAAAGELQPVYTAPERWQTTLDPPALVPPPEASLRRYAVQMIGVYPARGCPYRCNFCSVIKIAGRQIRSQPVETTMATLRAAKVGGVLMVMFTTDNFNKYPQAGALLQAMIDERIDLPFFVQCDTQIVRQPELIELLSRAGCYQMFIGVESFDRHALLNAQKNQNHPERYAELVALCRRHGIGSHFSNIIGFPDDTADTVLAHLRTLRGLAPDLASFYILTPIPGTEQYDEFLAAGRITETNLDRFDATYPTWEHAHLTTAQRLELLYRCYREFYALRHVLAKSARWYWQKRNSPNILLKIATPAYSLLARLGAAQAMHPMAGGMGRVRLDCAADYRHLRQATFACNLVPLPSSLPTLRPSARAA